jgi:GNAT superfamily N-acetyltransferase
VDVAITVATPGDREPLVGLLLAQMAEHAIDSDSARMGAAIDAVLADGRHGLLLVAWRGGAAVGVAYVGWFMSLEHGGPSAWLDELYVAPDQRNLGIGQRLLQAVIDHCRAKGARAIDLEVEADHARAANLYQRSGFIAHTRQRWVLRL